MATTMLVFSKDRAPQLNLFLQSLWRNGQRLADKKIVLWTVSEPRFRTAYKTCEDEHPDVLFVRERDFARQTREIVENATTPTFMLCVDDDVFYRPFSERITPGGFLMAHSDVLTVSLRLGKNTSFCYPLEEAQKVPPMTWRHGMFVFPWRKSQHDFSYPGSIDANVWRKSHLRLLLREGLWDSPNTLEEHLNREASRSTIPLIACYKQSLIFGNPVNVVQSTHPNRNGASFPRSVKDLNDGYLRGERLRVENLKVGTVRAAHHEVEL